METTGSKIIAIALVGAGIYIGYKNYKSPGFWYGALALVLAGGAFTIKIYKA